MKLIVGLGNPGDKYHDTRHNIGFAVLDAVAKAKGLNFVFEKKFNSLVCEFVPTSSESNVDANRTVLAKPQTYMNNSGEAVAAIVNYYKLVPEKDLLIVHDEVDLPLSGIRLSKGASSAGHKGVASIIAKLGDKNFARLRVGVETREDKSVPTTEAYVLSRFSRSELETVKNDIEKKALNAIDLYIKNNPPT